MPIIVSQADLHELVRSDEEIDRVIDAVEQALIDRHNGDNGHAIFADLPLEDANFFRVMAGTASGAATTVRIFPGQTNTAPRDDASFVLLLDSHTGALKALMAGDDIGALRTSVPAGVGARHLAPADAQVLGILGSGEQARGHARTITRALPNLSEIVVWSPTKANRERFAAEQAKLLGMPVRSVASAAEVVRPADVLTAAGLTDINVDAYDADWVKPGALVISMTRSTPRALAAKSQLVVPTQNRPELVAFGFVGRDLPRPPADPAEVIELGDVIAGKAVARAGSDQTVVFELANVYLWDQPIALWAHEWVKRNGLGNDADLSDSYESRRAS
jgi:alanine dehydrogenase